MKGETRLNDANGWQCGGWEGAERETLRHMASLTFAQKLDWLESAQQLVADLHGWEAALLPSGSTVPPRRMATRGLPPPSPPDAAGSVT